MNKKNTNMQPPPNPSASPLCLRILGAVGGCFFVLLVIATGLGTVSRYFGVRGFEWSFEIAGFTFIWVSFLGAVLAEARGENAAFEIVDAKLTPRVRAVIAKLRALALLLVGLFLFASSWAMVSQSGLTPTSVLRWPRVTQIAAICAAAMGIVIIALLRLFSRRDGMR